MFCARTGVAPGVVAMPVYDQSLAVSHVPVLAMRNCTSRRCCDCPAGAIEVFEQSTVT
jgi:hypothetical protein